MNRATITDGARLAALADLGLLDSDPDPTFDRFTRLAAELLDVPVSLISLVDRDRQFFKSAHGLSGSWAEARQTPLSHSFCQHVVANGSALAIADARRDAILADNLAVRDLGVVAYAGIPLILGDGHAVGALCAVDDRPRVWADRELTILADLAAAVTTMLDLRRTLTRQSLHDPLTGLPNRALTVAHADQLAADPEGELAVIALGVNDMRAVNDAYGTTHGDRVLRLTARRIAHQLTGGDVLGRLEGDVFAILRPRMASQLEAVELAHRIRSVVCAEPVSIRGERLTVTVTVGLATGSGEVDGATLIARAGQALHVAKRRRGHVTVADPATAERSARRLRIRAALAGAVARGEITVAFQPIVDLGTGQTRGFEALARWSHGGLGVVPPAEFVPVAEGDGEIVRIGEHVLEVACEQLAAWRAQSGEDLGVTVNLSPVQLGLPNLSTVIAEVLARTGLPGRALALEITEGMFLSPGALERRNLDRIRRLGVQIAIDDFGTGYSALSYLKRLPVDVLKVDRSFLEGLGSDRRDAALVQAILSIGSGMDLEVVAEGVETHAQRELLRVSGCRLGQGYLFARPLPAEEITVGLRPDEQPAAA